MTLTRDIGDRGEQAAAAWLEAGGFTIRHRNWRHGRYELDIVAEKDGMIHFIEVKCRRRGGLTSPEEAVTPAKFRSLARAAEAYLAQFELDAETQFDLISVEHSGERAALRYIPNALVTRW
jgi:putative endonuclease